ncbi:MAG TPA: Ig-like domain-containing protein [Dehalococcoidia bacterium]|nr:Ig-like domain-containing protein [Dehalococcoidia bacterium]
MTTGTSADPAPTPAYTVQEDPIATPTPISEDEGGVPEYEVEEDEVKDDEPAPPAQAPTQVQQQPPAQGPSHDPSPVVGTPVSATPVPPAPTPEPQNDAPYVLTVLPADGAIGVAVDANIVLHFSESMDKASVQAAFNLSTGNCGVFAWNSEATKLTFNPCNDFAYGTVVEVEIYETAADKLGLGMDDAFESSFRVLRQTTTKIYGEASRDGHVFVPGITNPEPTPYADAAQTTIALLNYSRGFLSFELDELPEDIVQITGATVHAKQASHSQKAYSNYTGPVLIQSVVYGTLTKSDWGLQAKPLCAKICLAPAPTSRVFSDTAADGWKSTDMLIAARNDWKEREARNYRSGFRLKFEKDCSGPCAYVAGIGFYSSDYTVANSPYMLVTYIHP